MPWKLLRKAGRDTVFDPGGATRRALRRCSPVRCSASSARPAPIALQREPERVSELVAPPNPPRHPSPIAARCHGVLVAARSKARGAP